MLLLEQRRADPPAVEDAIDNDLRGRDVKRDGNATAIIVVPQARPQIVPRCTALRESHQVATDRHDAIGIVARPLGAGIGRDVVVEFKKSASASGAKITSRVTGGLFFGRAEWCAASAAVTCSTERPRFGSACIAS